MTDRALRTYENLNVHGKQQYARKNFRTLLFQMVGCFELVLFWLRVHASARTLSIFHSIFTAEDPYFEPGQRLEMAVKQVKHFYADTSQQTLLDGGSIAKTAVSADDL